MDYISTKDAAFKWNVSQRNVQRLLKEKRIPGAKKYGNYWMIPIDAQKPLDPRRGNKKCADECSIFPCDCPIITMTSYYSVPGSANELISSFRDLPEIKILFSAQVAYLRGKIEEAKKLYSSLIAKTEVIDIKIASYTGLALVTHYTGDYVLWKNSRNKIIHIKDISNQRERTMCDLCLALIDSSIYDKREYPEFLKTGRFDPLPLDTYPLAGFLFAKYHIINHTNPDLLIMLEPLCSQSKAEHAVIVELYLRLLLAVGYHDKCDNINAAIHINRALDIALADGLYAPLAEVRQELGHLFDDILSHRDTTAMEEVNNLYLRLTQGWNMVYECRLKRSLTIDLTIREIEIIKYAAKGLSNKEIVKLTNISVNTVRSHIQKAMDKTGIHKRSDFSIYLSMS